MAEEKAKKEASIIEIIQEMVANGESEEKILSTLRDLGVSPEKAKRLLLVGQADTFALLRSEISKIVKSDLELEKPRLTKYIEEQARKATESMKQNIEKEVLGDLQKYEKDITGQSKTFQEQISETVSKVADLSDRVRNQLNALGAQVDTVQRDLDEMKVKGIGMRSRIISVLFIALGLGFCGMAGYFAFTYFSMITTGITIDAIIMLLAVGMIGITMLFVASLF
jgi:hypothetical protein